MLKHDANRKRALGEVVSVDAWHKPFTNELRVVDLYVDVVFSTARLGGEKESRVTFRLGLRKAELVININENEPVSIVKSSIAREKRISTGKKISKRTVSGEAAISGNAAAAAGPKRLTAEMELSASAEKKTSYSDETSVEEALASFQVTQRKTGDGRYCWDLSPTATGSLDGRPWDAEVSPRAKIRNLRKIGNTGIDPSISIEVRCLKEDIIISDIAIKDEKIWEKAKNSTGFDNRRAAAEAYIKMKIIEEGLELADFDNRFSPVILSSIMAEEAEDE